jgi:N6-adenosine-specific RNA methylase IME4
MSKGKIIQLPLFSADELPPPRSSFEGLEDNAYGMAMLDPAWTFVTRSAKGKGKSPEQHYDCMTLDEICAMPVKNLAHPDGMYGWLWATGCMDEYAHKVMDAWGVTYVTQGVWIKMKKDMTGPAFGTGYVLRNCHEPYYIFKVGKPKVTSRSVRSAILSPRRKHSQKPEEAYRDAELLSAGARRADLFSRQSRPGWESWGNERTKFDPPAPLELPAQEFKQAA